MSVHPAAPPQPPPVQEPPSGSRSRPYSCSTCAFADACCSEGYDDGAVAQMQAMLVDDVSHYEEGQHIFREGDPFDAIAAVRAGTVKTYILDREGREQVLGFFLPGEVVGLNAIHPQIYPCNAVALDTVVLCRFSFQRMSSLASTMPGLQSRLFRLLSEDIGKAALLSGDFSADERMAAFIVSLSRRYARRGFSGTRFHLPMARTDIANYLRLAPETVSRVLRRLRTDGVLDIDRRELRILDLPRLEQMAEAILRDHAH
ncbi:helix-turn-helix domain-containing protein [Pseudofulvimonas gallinarii]|nr:helix-turn-helix domain-containing protein [Pseudofulvimonas gallinarii]THD12771.1 transcriptional regulator [Pseudofulvimonas gallinarii]